MEKDKPSNDTVCPMCGKIPEDLELKDHEYFVWNRVFNRYICQFCDLELVIELYQMESKYFEMASQMMNLDIWEIKKKYLENVLGTCLIEIFGEINSSEREVLANRIARCKLQIHAIDRYLEVNNRENKDEIGEEFLFLQESMLIPAFDIDFVVPNLICVGIP